jgi:tellurite resistance protein TerC
MLDMLRVTGRFVRKGLILAVGATVLLTGIAMLVLPGPAVVVIPLGLAILAVEFAWAKRWLERSRSAVSAIGRTIDPPRRTLPP